MYHCSLTGMLEDKRTVYIHINFDYYSVYYHFDYVTISGGKQHTRFAFTMNFHAAPTVYSTLV